MNFPPIKEYSQKIGVSWLNPFMFEKYTRTKEQSVDRATLELRGQKNSFEVQDFQH